MAHAISINDEDDAKPFWRGATKRKLQESDDDKKASPEKKIKQEEEVEEKIAVDLSKTKAKPSSAHNQSKDIDLKERKEVKVIKYEAQKQKCKYGAKCYQKGDEHKKEFSHSDQDSSKSVLFSLKHSYHLIKKINLLCLYSNAIIF